MVVATRRIQLNLDEPHAGQDQLTEESRRFNVVVCGRRWGKSTDAIGRAVETLLEGKPVGWFNPSYPNLADAWRTIANALEPITARRSEQEHRIECVTGGVLECWSLDAPDSARGRAYARVIGDELAMARLLEMAWQNVIRPTLTDYEGDAWLYSTPRGLNFFHSLYLRGMDPQHPEWCSWQFPTTANPHIPKAEVEAARLELPERVFAQEYLAQFLEDGGGVFRGVQAAATATEDPQPKEGHVYVIGADWAKHEDFTVLTVLDATDRRMVFMDRFNQIDYPLQLERLRILHSHFKATLIIGERNAMGDPLMDQLRREGLPVWAFTTSNATKGAAIEDLALAFERQELQILNDPVLVGELQAYEAERLPSGMLRYGAPGGMHDDCVMSLALAWQGAKKHRKPQARQTYSIGTARPQPDVFEHAMRGR